MWCRKVRRNHTKNIAIQVNSGSRLNRAHASLQKHFDCDLIGNDFTAFDISDRRSSFSPYRSGSCNGRCLIYIQEKIEEFGIKATLRRNSEPPRFNINELHATFCGIADRDRGIDDCMEAVFNFMTFTGAQRAQFLQYRHRSEVGCKR